MYSKTYLKLTVIAPVWRLSREKSPTCVTSVSKITRFAGTKSVCVVTGSTMTILTALFGTVITVMVTGTCCE